MDELVAGRYRLEKLIGEGSVARVFRAIDTQTGRTVALKALRPHSGLVNERLGRFFAEMEHLRALESDAFIELIDVLHEGPEGQPAFVMELMRGPTLARRLEQGPLAAEDVIDLGIRVASGLQRAHERGIVHGDVKPSNIYLVDAGFAHAKIGDLGLGERIQKQTGTTQIGLVLGTPYYMSPEAASGGGRSPASDLWSLAVVLYECAYGRLPFNAPSLLAVLTKGLHEEPDFAPLPFDLHLVLKHALKKDPAARYASLADFAQALRALRLKAPQPGPFERPPVVIAPAPAPMPSPAPLPDALPELSVPGRTRLNLGPVFALGALLALAVVVAIYVLPRPAYGGAPGGTTLLFQALLMGVAAALATHLVIALVERLMRPAGATLASAQLSVTKVRSSDILTQSIALTVESLIQQSSGDPRVDLRRASLAIAIDELQQAKTMGDRKAALDRAIEIADKVHEQLAHKPWYVKHKDGIALVTAFAGAAAALISKLIEAAK